MDLKTHLNYLSNIKLFFINSLFAFFRSTTIILIFIFSCILCAFLVGAVSQQWFGWTFDHIRIPSLIFFTVYNFCCFLILPYLYSRFILNMSLSDIGWRIPQGKMKTITSILIAYAIMLPIICLALKNSHFHHFYHIPHNTLSNFLFIQFVILPFFYLSEEFFFRGFVFISLWNRIGWHSFWVTDLFFAFAHAFKPTMEILISIPASIVLCWLTLRTRSFFPAMLVHWTMGVMLNFIMRFS